MRAPARKPRSEEDVAVMGLCGLDSTCYPATSRQTRTLKVRGGKAERKRDHTCSGRRGNITVVSALTSTRPSPRGRVPPQLHRAPPGPRTHDRESAENLPAWQWDPTRQNAPEVGTRETGKAGDGEAGREQAKPGGTEGFQLRRRDPSRMV